MISLDEVLAKASKRYLNGVPWDVSVTIQVLVEAINRELNEDKPEQRTVEPQPEVLPCGHPAACAASRVSTSGANSVAWIACRWCEDIARLTEALNRAGKKMVEIWGGTTGI
jgi:hypothetical protein